MRKDWRWFLLAGAMALTGAPGVAPAPAVALPALARCGDYASQATAQAATAPRPA